MVSIIDYDAGNIKSVQKAVEFLGGEAILTRDRKELLNAEKVILPGVGSFGAAMDNLIKYELVDTIRDIIHKGTPFLGICLGMQLLFDSSEESPGVRGLSVIEGKCLKIPPKENMKIPHMGWNSLDLTDTGKTGKLFKGIQDSSYLYFVHSYYVKAENLSDVAGRCSYTTDMDVAIERDNIFACQFHPEKSSAKGLKILKNFIEL